MKVSVVRTKRKQNKNAYINFHQQRTGEARRRLAFRTSKRQTAQGIAVWRARTHRGRKAGEHLQREGLGGHSAVSQKGLGLRMHVPAITYTRAHVLL